MAVVDNPKHRTAPLRVALVGYGLAGKVFHAPLIAATDGLELAAVVSGDPVKVHSDFPDVPVLTDFGAILSDAAMDVVVLATPDHLHCPQALAALDAGKHVVVDKPFAMTLGEARRITETAAARGRIVSVFQNRRWDADFLTLKRLVAEGGLGEILQFESHFDRYRPDTGQRWKDRRDGGVWQDLGPHLVDQALQLLGPPLAVFADIGIQKPGGPAPDYAHVLLRYERARVLLHCSQSVPEHGLRFVVHGTGGSYFKSGLDPQEEQAKAGLRPGDPRWGVDPGNGLLSRVEKGWVGPAVAVENEHGNYQAFYAGLCEALRAGGPNPVPPEQAIAVMAILDAGIASARDGCEVRL